MLIRSLVLSLCAVLLAGAVQAQQPAAPNPMDVVPDKMPFDLPFGAPVTAEQARSIVAAAAAEAKKRNWAMNIAVVDWSGNLVAFERMDDAQIASIAIAQHKAKTAAIYRRETKAFEAGVQGGALYQLTLDGVIASRGGIPLVEGGKIIGAIGCSGGTGSQDEVTAKAGAAVINK